MNQEDFTQMQEAVKAWDLEPAIQTAADKMTETMTEIVLEGMNPEIGRREPDWTKLTEAEIEAVFAKMDFELAPWLQSQIDEQIDNQGEAQVVDPLALPPPET